jgi:hypothetical protein
MDIGDWLRKLDLGQYEPAFRRHDIDLEILKSLTAEDLRGIGVRSIGHRRKLLEAIAALSEARARTEEGIPPAGASSAERRLLTIVFCDVVGSTELSTQLDPEDLREVIGAYHRCVGEVLIRFGGFVAKYMGDGVLAYFGYPQSHEEDAEQAVRAALAIVEAVGRLKLEWRLEVPSGLGPDLPSSAIYWAPALRRSSRLLAKLPTSQLDCRVSPALTRS